MSKRKTKTLSIRISEDEYETLKNTHTSTGTRSVSAFAREALQRIIANPSAHNNAAPPDVHSLDRRLAVLQNEVTRLSRTVAESLSGKRKD